ILQYLADMAPAAGLAPSGGMARSRLQQWLCFTGTELHKALFVPLFDPKTPDEAKARALEKGESRLAYLNTYLTGREFLLDRWAAPTISSTCTPDPEQSFPDPSRAERVGTVECSGSASNLLGSYPQGRTGRPRSQQEGPVRAAE